MYREGDVYEGKLFNSFFGWYLVVSKQPSGWHWWRVSQWFYNLPRPMKSWRNPVLHHIFVWCNTAKLPIIFDSKVPEESRVHGLQVWGLVKLAMAWSLLWAVVSLIEVVSRCVQRCVLTRPCSGWKHIHFPNVTISVIEYRLHTINWKNNTSKVEKDIACTCVCYCRKWRQFKFYVANLAKSFIERTHV